MSNFYILLIGFFTFLICFNVLLFGYDFILGLLVQFNLLVSSDNNKPFFTILFSLLISFACGIIFFFFNLNRKNRELNEVLNELNFQKYTLDEHSIVSMTDTKGNIIYVNDKFCQISGYSRDELLGENHRIVKSGTHSSEFFQDLRKTITNGKVWHGEVKNKTKNGEFYWVRATIVPFFDINNNITRFVSIRTDITEAKKVQKNLLKAKLAIEETNKIKSEFLANMSHELKTPLNSINLLSSIMMKNKNQNLDNEQIKNLTIINKSGKKLLDLINDVLEISKLDAKEIEVKVDSFNLKDFMLEIEEKFQKKLEQSALFLELIIDKEIENIKSDKDKLEQILVNLIDNAIKFTTIGKITIRVKNLDENEIEISVKDEGIGILKEKIPLIFQRFTQIDGSTTRKYSGTGLGLSICKELVSLLNGKIWLKSEFKVGSTFFITIQKNLILKRKTEDNESQNELLLESLNEIIEEKKSVENQNVLILNSNPVSYFNIIVNLKRKYNKVESLNDIDKFFKILEEETFNKIIIDFDNLQNEDLIKIFDYCEDVYIAKDDFLEIDDELKKRVRKFIKKPFKFDDLIMTLES